MMRMTLLVLALALAGCKAEVAQMKQALSGQPPVVAGTLLGHWQVVDVNGGGVVAGATPQLQFSGDDKAGDVAGNAGCNRITARWQRDGAGVKIGPLAGTRVACPAPVLAMEAKLLAVLDAASSLTFDASGAARLVAPDGRRLTLRPDTP